MHLLRNIKKTKAFRLPANVGVSTEFAKMLKLLLDRNPHSRAGLSAFFEAVEAFVALGCNGIPAVPLSTHMRATANRTDNEMSPLQAGSSGQKVAGMLRNIAIQRRSRHGAYNSDDVSVMSQLTVCVFM